MNDEFISIESHYNPRPRRQRQFTVECFTTRILTTVTPTPSVVRSWIYKIRHFHRFRRHKLVVGLGVQWRPSFTTGVSNPPATLQLCVGRRCLIFQLLHAHSVPVCLRRFLSDPLITFVGVWNHNDEALLRRSKHSLSVSTLVDLRYVAEERRGLSRGLSMEKLAEILLGADDVKKPKRIGNSAWDAYLLSEEQVQYACVDAFLSFSMGRKMRVWNWVP